jgi:hypothetical protein
MKNKWAARLVAAADKVADRQSYNHLDQLAEVWSAFLAEAGVPLAEIATVTRTMLESLPASEDS